MVLLYGRRYIGDAAAQRRVLSLQLVHLSAEKFDSLLHQCQSSRRLLAHASLALRLRLHNRVEAIAMVIDMDMGLGVVMDVDMVMGHDERCATARVR